MPAALTSATHNLSHLLGSPVDDEVREFYRLRDLAGAAQADVARLNSPAAVARAGQLDTDALADALTAGQDDPGQRHEDARQVALRAAQRRVTGLNIAVERAYAAVLDAVAEAAPEWLADLTAEREALRARVSTAVTALAAALDEIDQANALTTFVTAVAEDEPLTVRNVRGPLRGRLLLDRATVAVDGGLAAVPADVVLAALAGYTGTAV